MSDHRERQGERDGMSLLLDVVLTIWCLVVAITFYGGYLAPDTIGMQTGSLSGIYSALVLMSAFILAFRYLRRQPEDRSVNREQSSVEQSASRAGSTGESELDR